MTGETHGKLVDELCRTFNKAQLDRFVKEVLNRPLEHYAILEDLPSIADKLLTELEKTPEDLEKFLVRLRLRNKATIAQSATGRIKGGISDGAEPEGNAASVTPTSTNSGALRDDTRQRTEYLFLSEFDDFPFVQRLVSDRKLTPLLVIVWVFLALVPIVLGQMAHANCMHAWIRNDPPDAKEVEVRFGFLAEPNHGWYYLIGVPILIFTTIDLFKQASKAFRLFAIQDQLFVLDNAGRIQGEDPVTRRQLATAKISQWNRRFGMVAFVISLVVAIALILGTELPSLKNKWFGWVQAGTVLQLDGLPLSQLDSSPLYNVMATWAAPNVSISDRSAVWNEIRTNRDLNLIIRLDKPTNTKEARHEIERWSSWFVGAGLFIEIAALTLVVWFVAKTFLVLGILLSVRWNDRDQMEGRSVAAHSRLTKVLRRKAILQLGLDFRDPNHRFGIGHLDRFYWSVLITGMFMAAVFYLGRLSNLAKGTAWPYTHNVMLIGQALIPFAIVLTTTAVCFYPGWHLWRWISDSVDSKIELNLEDRALIESQSLWPGWREGYVLSAWVVFVIVVLFPLGIEPILHGVLGRAGDELLIKFAQYIQHLCCGLM